MYKVDHISETLCNLNDMDCVSEIIVIENDRCPNDKIRLNKIIYLDLYENIGCNPAWNLAIKIASSDYICLLSDDILFDFEKIFLKLLETNILDECGIVGLGTNCYSDTRIHDDNNIEIVPSYHRGYGFGCSMFLRKDNYVEIPNQLKICWGDEWLYRYQIKQNYEIYNLHTNNLVGVTAGHPSNSETLKNDTLFWSSL